MAHILLLLFLLSTAASAQPPPPLTKDCSDQLVALSPCLLYISLPPPNLTAAPSSPCCNHFSATNATCLCNLIQQPLLLGVPLSAERLKSLSSLCPLPRGADMSPLFSCSGTQIHPPPDKELPEDRRQKRYRHKTGLLVLVLVVSLVAAAFLIVGGYRVWRRFQDGRTQGHVHPSAESGMELANL